MLDLILLKMLVVPGTDRLHRLIEKLCLGKTLDIFSLPGINLNNGFLGVCC
jgi:hypothetical protein